MRIALITLGCPKNLVDAEHMLGALDEAGHTLVGDPADADVVIVNTCSFIEPAVRESCEVIGSVIGLRETGWPGRVLVAGCLPERFGERTIDLVPGVDAVVGCSAVGSIAEAVGRLSRGESSILTGRAEPLVDGRLPRILGTPGHIAYIRISEGCDNRCAYCLIPSIRGGLRSRPLDDIVAEARELEAVGVRELVPVAQDTTAYGMDIASSPSAAGLLTALDGVGIPWIRLLYAHPARVSDALIDVVRASDHVVRYLDLPIQHVDDRILQAMNRRTDGAFIRRLVDRIRDRVPGITLRTSVIVGFPGEDDRAFEALRSFLDDGAFEHVGVFEYSPEEGTAARELGDGPSGDVVRERAGILMSEARVRTEARHRDLVGTEVDILVDEPGPRAVGRTEGLAWELDGVVRIDDPDGALTAGSFARVVMTGAEGYDLTGEPAGRAETAC
jgi:ribosomal protein S12 methylthiotransferase